MNAERAAQQIVEAARHGDAELIVSLPAKLVVNGVGPGAGLHRPCDGSHQCAIATPPTTPATARAPARRAPLPGRPRRSRG